MEQNFHRDDLYQHWIHSHEEDTDKEMVFRPATFNFPRSRGRRSFELKSNGDLVETRIGSTDRPEKLQGNWKLENSNLIFYTFSQLEPSRVMRIASLEKNRLVIKK
jgi:hypothetical protein